METQAAGTQPARTISEDSPAADVIAWSLERFAHQRVAITTSFGMEGCALIDMYGAHGKPLTVIYLDTMFFFPETYELRDRMVDRFPHITFVNRGTTMTPEQQAAKYGEELWKRDSDLCCKLRKVDPMREALSDVDVWLTALRRSQSATRANMSLVEWDWKFQLVKINPLAAWDRKQVWEYIQERSVPYNELHEKGFPSVGCMQCTSPVEGHSIGEYSRAGRWNGKDKTECGLHGYGI